MPTSEEFILIIKNQFMKEQPYVSEQLNDPIVQHTGAEFSFLLAKGNRKFWIQGKQMIPLSFQKTCEQNSSKSYLAGDSKIYDDGENGKPHY